MCLGHETVVLCLLMFSIGKNTWLKIIQHNPRNIYWFPFFCSEREATERKMRNEENSGPQPANEGKVVF